MHGAIGYGMYFLNRYRSSSNPGLKNQYLDKLKDLLEGLDRLAERDGDSLTWVADAPLNDKPPCYDFSHAHGLSGISSFLCRVYPIPALQSKAKSLLEGTLQYILKHKSPDDNSISFFPSKVFDPKDISHWGRVGWCYGDIGPAMAFSRAGQLLGRKDLQVLSQQLFTHEAVKRDPKITFTVDSAFCHGSFGNAHIFQHVFNETQDKIFKEATDFWISDGFEKGNHQGSPAGFAQRDGENKKWLDVYSLLEGVAGIGLVMINQLSDKKLNWDEILMIS